MATELTVQSERAFQKQPHSTYALLLTKFPFRQTGRTVIYLVGGNR